jgi:hypothetical protein
MSTTRQSSGIERFMKTAKPAKELFCKSASSYWLTIFAAE